MLRTNLLRSLAAAAFFCAAQGAVAQEAQLDQADPSVVEDDLRETERRQEPTGRQPLIERERAASVATAESVMVGAIRVEGATALPPSAFAPVLEPYVGRLLSPQDLRRLASSIANVARNAGYGLATAWVPEQRIVNGVLRVNLEEGRIDEIEAEGDAARIAETMLSPLANGRPVKTSQLERQLLLVGDVAGVSLGRARLERRGGRNILRVTARRDRAQLRAYLDNWGSSSVGPVRARINAYLNGVVGGNDRLTIGAVATPLDPGEFTLGRLGYERGIGRHGTQIAIDGYYARSNPGGALRDRDIEGTSIEGEVGLTHPFLRTRASSLWGDIKFGVRDASQTRTNVKVRDDRFALLSAGAYAFSDVAGGRLKGRIRIVQGLDAFDATQAGDALASRDDGSALFTKGELWAQYERPLGGAFSIQLATEGQIASRPLLSSEEMGLGGRYFLRGYDYREFSGDKGIAGSAELRFDLKDLPRRLKSAQLYVYGDAGSVGNYRGGGGGGTLASAGGGIRATIGPVEAGVELGVPLRDGYDGNRDPRFSFTLAARF